jgi:hypothetical protein
MPNETEDEDCDAYPQCNKCGDKAKIIKRATKLFCAFDNLKLV